jgi:hypothetical protein
MNATASTKSQNRSLESASFAAILGLVTEMAKRINENIAKVQLRPIPVALTATGISETTEPGVEASEA